MKNTMKETLKMLGKEDIANFKKKTEKKDIHALEIYSDKEEGHTLVTIYNYRYIEVGKFYFDEQNYFEKLDYYQMICDCLIRFCNVNRKDSSKEILYFKPKHSKNIRTIIVWYLPN